jgi:hypothetical protein
MIGLACGIAAAELNGNPLTTPELSATPATQGLKATSTVCTALLLLMILRKYSLEYKLLLERGLLLRGGEGFTDSGLVAPMLCELVICSMHCPVGVYWRMQVPNLGVEITYDMDALLSIFMCLRLYLLFAVVDDSLGFRSAQARIVQNVHNLRFNFFFTFKAGLELNPMYVCHTDRVRMSTCSL